VHTACGARAAREIHRVLHRLFQALVPAASASRQCKSTSSSKALLHSHSLAIEPARSSTDDTHSPAQSAHRRRMRRRHNEAMSRAATARSVETVRSGKLDAVLASCPALGARRLTLIAAQLAAELDLALRTEVTPGKIRADSISVENAGTPFERVRIPWAAQQTERPDARAALRELGWLIGGLLADKPLYLEESVWMPPHATRVLRRRADAEVVHAIGRALMLIAQRCIGSSRAYESAAPLLRDLNRLSVVVSRIVAQRRASPPVVRVSRPRPASSPCASLPSVMISSTELPVSRL
jgi:hypothetical protein